MYRPTVLLLIYYLIIFYLFMFSLRALKIYIKPAKLSGFSQITLLGTTFFETGTVLSICSTLCIIIKRTVSYLKAVRWLQSDWKGPVHLTGAAGCALLVLYSMFEVMSLQYYPLKNQNSLIIFMLYFHVSTLWM